MKDAHGHGSDGGSASLKTAGLRGVGISTAARISPTLAPKGNTDAARTVFNLRAQMQSTGPGHRSALAQGIKNLIGG